MESQIREILKQHRRKTITNREIQSQLPGESTLSAFEHAIEKLIEAQILLPSSKSKSSYQINKHLLMKTHYEQIIQTQMTIKSDMKLEAYLSLPESIWAADYPYILLIDDYFQHPNKGEMSISECAYFITGNEKWINEAGGKEILQRLGVWERLNIVLYNDPLALTINKKLIDTSCKHLIVENKSIFYRISNVIEELPIASVIYGEGWHITSGVENLLLQLGVKDEEKDAHTFYYCGDLDWEGIAIWHSISDRMIPAVPFYKGMLQHSLSLGKTTQLQNPSALESFLSFFNKEEQSCLKRMLDEGKYIPQEALNTEEMIEAGRLL